MGESHRMKTLEERGQGAGGAAQDGKDGVSGGSPLLGHEIRVDGEGGILDCL